ncbi:MAG TPA: YggT family protein [Solirubrobacteraceae bacterium]|jgi:YggT family protein|nr:YggT family protein [Solirubrobacteraceae bacterium]
MIALAAITRGDVANYVSALIFVYIVLIFIHILLTMLFSFGMRVPYARWTSAVLNFLRDVCDPYLRLFRRFIPPLGAFDLSPMVAIIVLYVLRTVLVSLIAG